MPRSIAHATLSPLPLDQKEILTRHEVEALYTFLTRDYLASPKGRVEYPYIIIGRHACYLRQVIDAKIQEKFQRLGLEKPLALLIPKPKRRGRPSHPPVGRHGKDGSAL